MGNCLIPLPGFNSSARTSTEAPGFAPGTASWKHAAAATPASPNAHFAMRTMFFRSLDCCGSVALL